MAWTNQGKNSATFSNQAKSGSLVYLLTDALDYILVGASEDLTLILSEATPWTNQIKN